MDLLNIEVQVLAPTILVRLSGFLRIFRIRPNGHLLGGRVSSDTRAMSLTMFILLRT